MASEARRRLTCQDVIGLLIDFLETSLTPQMVEAFEAHLEACPPCVAYLNTYRKTRELTGAAGHVEMPEDIRARLREILLKQLERGSPGT